MRACVHVVDTNFSCMEVKVVQCVHVHVMDTE